jgi:hypothetical protein
VLVLPVEDRITPEKTDSCPGKRFQMDAVVAALEGRNDGEISFCETQAVSKVRTEAA